MLDSHFETLSLVCAKNSRFVIELTRAPLKANELMVIEPTRAFDVVPSGRLMAGIALVHFRAGRPRDRRRHHPEVIHGVAGWRLMALRALAGTHDGWQNSAIVH